MSLDRLLDRYSRDSEALRRTGDTRTADLLARMVSEVSAAAEDYLTWLSEADAVLRSGHAARWFVVRRESWKRDGHARQVSRTKWEYRACIVPRRANVAHAAAEGREAARRMMQGAA